MDIDHDVVIIIQSRRVSEKRRQRQTDPRSRFPKELIPHTILYSIYLDAYVVSDNGQRTISTCYHIVQQPQADSSHRVFLPVLQCPEMPRSFCTAIWPITATPPISGCHRAREKVCCDELTLCKNIKTNKQTKSQGLTELCRELKFKKKTWRS